MSFELILSTESRVITTNITAFEKQANQYLSTLTRTFETDDDFARAKSEVKELQEIETKIRTAIKSTVNGEIAELVATAENIAERFRQERLSREKLVKNKEAEIKQQIINDAFENTQNARKAFESDVCIALENVIPKANVRKRIEEATKRRNTLATLTKAVNAEVTQITAEITTEAARIAARRKLIPVHYEYLFKDWITLISGTEDLQSIIDSRIAAEQQREMEMKAKAEQEIKAKAEAEKVQAEAKAIADEIAQSAVNNSQEIAQTEPLADFVITVRLNQTTQSQAVAIARSLKVRFGDGVTLNKAK